MHYDDLTSALGYAGSPMFCEDDGDGLVAPSDRHWLRAARDAGVRGSYLFRTSPEPQALRPAVHVAQAPTVDAAREIHRRLWNQGVNPFLIVVLPTEVRVFTGFAYNPDPHRKDNGEIAQIKGTLETIREALSTFTADAINRGEIWRAHAKHLRTETRVDTTLLQQLGQLSDLLSTQHNISESTCHSLIGKFVYLSYLRARNILSDKWLREEAQVEPKDVFETTGFSASVTLQNFRKLARAVESRFNGLLFPIPWGSPCGPRADAIRRVARVFAGEDILSGQLHLPFTAYDFSNIPVEFLSSIYEQFLHKEGQQDDDEDGHSERGKSTAEASDPEQRGAHYTPEPLADYLVAEVASIRPLRVGMRILDPCCGSGVFLVVAYRRLVELECQRQGQATLLATELRDLLVDSIFAVERNRTACQIAAFSLILTLLSYVDPPELHARKNFKFPSLIGSNLFCQDFFDDGKHFWQLRDQKTGKPIVFDWIIGNPPWVELSESDPKAKHIFTWSKEHAAEYGLARARTGEAFAWRVMNCLAVDGAVGLILHAKTLSNDHLAEWRKKFFGGVQVHRVTNLANLAYVIFPSAQQPATTIVYSQRIAGEASTAIKHYGPFVANQTTIGASDKGKTKRRSWTIGFSESEVKTVDATEAASGAASVWKFALWGNQRDRQTVRRLRRIFSTTLGALAATRGWHLSLGLQLRKDAGTEKDRNTYIKELEGLRVLDHKSFLEANPPDKRSLTVPDTFLIENYHGCFVRNRGGLSGTRIYKGPHLFLCHDFAAFSPADFIILHSKPGLSGGTSSEMKAVAAIWNSSFIAYLLFFVMSSEWGFSYNQIDKGDVTNLPFPNLDAEREEKLTAAWNAAAELEACGEPFEDIRKFLDERVAESLGLPFSITFIVREFFRVRYKLNKGKSPFRLRESPNEPELMAYTKRLRAELDGFLDGKARHAIVVRHSGRGIAVSIRLTSGNEPIAPVISLADGGDVAFLDELLEAAEQQFSQWVYVKRNVRIFDGDTLHLIKPQRRLEWTETQALLDADDIIAEVLDADAARRKPL